MPLSCRGQLLALVLTVATAACAPEQAVERPAVRAGEGIGRYQVSTLPLPVGLRPLSATYTPSGKVLVSYGRDGSEDERQVNLATLDDDGRNFRTFFSQAVTVRPKDNGIRFMVFPDNRRIFLGDFVLECATSLETCETPELLPVDYPPEVAEGDHISHRWSEMIVAPDNRSIAWTTLLSNYSALVFTGELEREGARYRISQPQIVSTLDPFEKDPAHADGVLPQLVRGGEVKQFVHGGTAISLAGGIRRDIPDTTVLHLDSGRMETITDTPGYTETTIFSPDERLGLTMTTRFSPADPAILGLVPRPYPDSLNMGLAMLAYTYSVTGVRRVRPGNIGPALIDIAASKRGNGYLGVNLNSDPEWVFNSPMSWHPTSTRALWPEGRRGTGERRIQVVRLTDYRPGPPVPARATPHAVPYAVSDLSVVKDYAKASRDIDVKVYGRAFGHLTYRRSPDGTIMKTYENLSNDGRQVWSGSERMQANPAGRSTYVADVTLSGPRPGRLVLQMTFGPLGGPRPAELIFAADQSGRPATRGYAEYGGLRLEASSLAP
jgi:hypothetical protein